MLLASLGPTLPGRLAVLAASHEDNLAPVLGSPYASDGVSLTESDVRTAAFVGTDLNLGFLDDVKDMRDTNLQDITATGKDLSGWEFSGSDLSGADLSVEPELHVAGEEHRLQDRSQEERPGEAQGQGEGDQQPAAALPDA